MYCFKSYEVSKGLNVIVIITNNENHDNAIAMSSSHADPVMGLNILQG